MALDELLLHLENHTQYCHSVPVSVHLKLTEGDCGPEDCEDLIVCAYMLSSSSHVQLFATLWTVAHQAPPSIGFSRQEFCSGLPCPPPVDLPDPGIEPMSLISPPLEGRFFTTSTTWEAPDLIV